jgi:hypothetical protein
MGGGREAACKNQWRSWRQWPAERGSGASNGAKLSKSIQTFYNNVIESSSNEEANNDTELMMAASMLLHEHTLRLVYRGSVKGSKANVKPNHERGHYQLYLDYFHPTRPIFDAQRFWCRYWYVSNISIIFDAPCLFLHHLLSVLLHFMAFYAFSRTNLLTRCHSVSSLFSAIFVF